MTMKLIPWTLIAIFSAAAPVWAQVPLPVPSFDAPARAVGTYQITDVKKNDQSLCDPAHKVEAIDPLCGKFVWAVRNDNQLALLAPKTSAQDRGPVESVFFRDGVVHRGCVQKLALGPALKGGIFKDRFCRSFLSDSLSGANSEFFDFSEGTPEMSTFPKTWNPAEVATTIGLFETALTTVPEIFLSASLPKGEISPKSFTLTKTVGMLILLIPHFEDTVYQLTYVSN